MAVSGIASCSSIQPAAPSCLTRAMDAGVGPKLACSSRRAAARSAVPWPVPGLVGAAIVTLACAEADVLAAEVARNVTVAGEGTAAGAV
jgi:hypothetical protein